LKSNNSLKKKYKYSEQNIGSIKKSKKQCTSQYLMQTEYQSFQMEKSPPSKRCFNSRMSGCILNIKPSNFVFCGLHCIARITEKLLRLLGRVAFEYEKFESYCQKLEEIQSQFKVVIEQTKETEDDGMVSNLNSLSTNKANKVIARYLELIHSTGINEQLTQYNSEEKVPIADKKRYQKWQHISKIWKEWQYLSQILRQHSPVDAQELQKVEQSLKSFDFHLKFGFSHADVTPYIHIMTCGLCDLLKSLPGNAIGPFSQQAFEARHKHDKWGYNHKSTRRGFNYDEQKWTKVGISFFDLKLKF